MSDKDVTVSFVVDYQLSVDDLREAEIIRRSAARRAKPLVNRWAWPVLSLVAAVGTVFLNQKTIACFLPDSTPSQAPFQVWVWQCQRTSPSDLLWNNGWLFAAVGAVCALTLIDLVNAWARLPRWYLGKRMKKQGLQGRYHYEVAADGLTGAGPDGVIAYIPWPVVAAVRETPERFFLLSSGRRYRHVWVLPKRGLTGQSPVQPVQQLGEFLRASVARPA